MTGRWYSPNLQVIAERSLPNQTSHIKNPKVAGSNPAPATKWDFEIVKPSKSLNTNDKKAVPKELVAILSSRWNFNNLVTFDLTFYICYTLSTRIVAAA